MKTSDAGIYALALHEGIVPSPYKDSVGVWTFGIGHTAAAGGPDPATMPKGMPADLDRALARVFEVFRQDLPKYEADVNRALKVPVTQAQFDALVSFHYNTGAIGRASLVKKLNAGNVAGAAAGFMAWKKPPEIIERRKAEQALFATGTYPGGLVTVWGATSAGKVVWKPVKRLNMPQVLALVRGHTTPPAAAPQSARGAAAVGGQTPAAVQRTPINAPPAAYVAAVLAAAYAAWEWGAGVVDWLTFWN